MNTIPLEAAKWIESYLASVGHTLPSYKVEILRGQGLEILTLNEIKQLWKGIEPILYPIIKQKPKSGARKADWIRATRQCFFQDEACRKVDKEVVKKLPKSTVPTVAPPGTAISRAVAASMASTSSRPNSTRKSPAAKKRRMSLARAPPAARAPPPPTASTYMYPNHASWMHPMMHHPSMAAAGMPTFPAPQPWNNPWAALPQSPPRANTFTTAPQQQSSPGKATPKIKTEPEQYELQPQTQQEWQMVHRLKQMGFSDMREILAGIRHVQSVDMNSRVEKAMMWIVTQREEADEARKLDLARLSSEAARTEQAQKRNLEAEQRLLTASIDEWKQDFFAESVLIEKAGACLQTVEKPDAIRLLQLEKKARKWYGTAVPWCYFCNLSEQFHNLKNRAELMEAVRKESQQLEHAMFSLSEQQGGVPRLFLEARNDAKQKGMPTSPEKSSFQIDGDVVIVEELPANSNHDVEAPTSNGSLKNGANQKVEIIDLL